MIGENTTTEKDVNDLLTAIRKEFGTVPLDSLKNRMESMASSDLKKLVVIACNKIGYLEKGSEYKTTNEALWYLNKGADELLTAYDNALMATTQTKH